MLRPVAGGPGGGEKQGCQSTLVRSDAADHKRYHKQDHKDEEQGPGYTYYACWNSGKCKQSGHNGHDNERNRPAYHITGFNCLQSGMCHVTIDPATKLP